MGKRVIKKRVPLKKLNVLIFPVACIPIITTEFNKPGILANKTILHISIAFWGTFTSHSRAFPQLKEDL